MSEPTKSLHCSLWQWCNWTV